MSGNQGQLEKIESTGLKVSSSSLLVKRLKLAQLKASQGEEEEAVEKKKTVNTLLDFRKVEPKQTKLEKLSAGGVKKKAKNWKTIEDSAIG